MLESFLPVKKLSELTVERNYRVTDLRYVKTKFGQRITIDIDKQFTCYLPERFVKVLDQDPDLFQQMTTAAHGNNLLMEYHGTRYNNLQFKPARETMG